MTPKLILEKYLAKAGHGYSWLRNAPVTDSVIGEEVSGFIKAGNLLNR
jgi:hypothetical protein